jgi:hypothetical protein
MLLKKGADVLPTEIASWLSSLSYFSSLATRDGRPPPVQEVDGLYPRRGGFLVVRVSLAVEGVGFRISGVGWSWSALRATRTWPRYSSKRAPT